MRSKRFEYDYEDYEEKGKNAATMAEEILSDQEFPELEEIEIGSWGGCWEEGCQPLLDAVAKQPEKFVHIKSFIIGDMDCEDCEISWIIQGNYNPFLKALKGLKKLEIYGSTDLEFGDISHDSLEELTIVCGGIPSGVMESIGKAKLPNLTTLRLYLGIENYGFDGGLDSVLKFLEQSNFPKLSYLGLMNSEIQDEVTELVLHSKYMKQIDTLDLSCGTLQDTGGQMLLDELPKYPNIKKLDIHHHYLSDAMMKKLKALPIEVDASEQEEPEEYDDEILYDALITE